MKKLSEEKINKLVKPYNKETGVNAITREMLDSVDLDLVPHVLIEFKNYCGDHSVLMSDGRSYSLDRFTPRSGSYAFKPSFAGSQVLIGKDKDDDLIFSNGRWFSTFAPDDIKARFPELFK